MKIVVAFVALWALASGQMQDYVYPCHTVEGFMDVTEGCHYIIKDQGGDTMNEKLDNFCGPTMAAYTECVRTKFEPCLMYQASVDFLLAEYKARFCNGDTLKPEVEELRHTLNCLFGESCDCPDTCSWEDVKIQMDVCYSRWYNHELFDYTLNPTEMEWARLGLRALGKSVLRCIRNYIEMKPTPPCDPMTRDAVIYYNLAYVMAPGPDVEYADATKWLEFNDRSTITAFGDPHFRIFDQEAAKLGTYTIVTCSSMLWQNFLSTHYLKIGAFNVPAGLDGEFDESTYNGEKLPSIMAKFKLTFYDNEGDEIASYWALHGHFPEKLNYPKGAPETDALELSVQDGGTRMVIQYPAPGIVVTAYAHGRYFLVLSVRMANGLIAEGSGLMKDGCPVDEQVEAPDGDDGGNLNMAGEDDLPDVRRRKKRATESECEEACVTAYDIDKAVGDACMFDCAATGDVEMAARSNPAEAEKALADMDDKMFDSTLAAAKKNQASTNQGKADFKMPDNGASVTKMSSLASLMVIVVAKALFA